MAEKEIKTKKCIMTGGYVSKDLTFQALDILELTDEQLKNKKIAAKAIELTPENIKLHKIRL